MAVDSVRRFRKSVEPSKAKQPSSRALWLDYAKGIGIVLVVIGHVVRGLMNASLIANVRPYEVVDTFIYAFHMPLFFFLSGLLLHRALQKDLPTILVRKAKTVLYPYLIWSLLQGGIAVALSKYVNNSYTFRDLLLIPIIPIEQFWFLYALFGITAIFAVATKLGLKSKALLIISLTIYVLFPYLNVPSWTLAIVLRNSVYVALGLCLSAMGGFTKLNQWASNANALTLTGVFLASSFVVYQAAMLGKAVSPFLVLAPALIGIVLTLCLAFLMSRINIFTELEKFGRLSLEIFLAHTLASASCRIFLDKILGIDALSLHLILGIAAGIYVPILLKLVADRMNFKYLFTYP